FNGGSLAVTHGGIVNGMLTGAGELAVNGGTLTVNGANAAMTAATTIADGAEVALNDISGIGAGDILDNGLLTLNEGVQGVLGNNLTGSGNLQKNGSGLVSLTTASAQYTGTTDINGGGLQLGDSSTDVTLASSTVNVKEGAVFGGYGGTAGDVNNAGTLTLGDISPRLMALRAGGEARTFGIGKNLTNSGTINVSQPGSTTAGNILHVTGDYTGSGGTLNLNTQLGDDSSPTDKLVVDGSTHGTTTVAVNNVGGTGAATLNGIEVVSVGGTSDGEFSKKGRIVAGAYDYDLVKKGSNWYLTNNGATPVDPVDPVDPVNPVDPVDPVVPDDGG
ncbi:autotransporter outer membrane beta-barrel domain-containing protein, partial [Enterobacteriaceae bacterium H11S18]|uniref:autotransporter outer membrane beta-barrel domain-containing protein n=1 Tax=Dryocola clanedunensis TaxID=2925396 RepID=UPI0022F143BD